MPRTKIELKDAKSRSTRYKRKKEIVEQARALELETLKKRMQSTDSNKSKKSGQSSGMLLKRLDSVKKDSHNLQDKGKNVNSEIVKLDQQNPTAQKNDHLDKPMNDVKNELKSSKLESSVGQSNHFQYEDQNYFIQLNFATDTAMTPEQIEFNNLFIKLIVDHDLTDETIKKILEILQILIIHKNDPNLKLPTAEEIFKKLDQQ